MKKKKNYMIQNRIDAEIIFNDLRNLYNKIEIINKRNDENIVGILFHELMYFFVSNKCRKNLESYTKIIDNNPRIKFGKRNNKDIFSLKNNSNLVKNFFSIYSFFFKRLNLKKKIYISKSISLSFKNKILIILFSFFNGYELVLTTFKDIKINLSNQTKLFFLKEIKKLLIKNNLNLNNLIDIEIFVNKISSKKDSKYKIKKKGIIISGTLAELQNRLLAAKKYKLNSKLLVINHILTYGVVSYKTLKYDEFYLCDYFLTPGRQKKILKDDNYLGIDHSNYKLLPITNNNYLFSSNFVKKINFKNLKSNKILYIPNRTANTSLSGKDYLYKKNYEEWQNFLANKFGKIDAKFPYKKINYKINNNFNVLDTNLKLLKILSQYDLVIIDYISSTTFGEVASTDVPILYFNLNRDDINSEAAKLIKQRVYEIKIDIFNNFKGFENVNKLTFYNRKKNKFKSKYLDTLVYNSFYQNLKEIDNQLNK